MADQAFTEKREHARHPLATSVEFYHGPTQKQFPARCVDISSGGVLMFVPPNVPVRVGHPVQLAPGSFDRAELGVNADKAVDGTVVRVDRGGLLASGQLAVGIRFDNILA